jgi:hypothetical protein
VDEGEACPELIGKARSDVLGHGRGGGPMRPHHDAAIGAQNGLKTIR